MDNLTPTIALADAIIEILPPERDICVNREMPFCDCCGRRAAMDEDCCGICEECLSP